MASSGLFGCPKGVTVLEVISAQFAQTKNILVVSIVPEGAQAEQLVDVVGANAPPRLTQKYRASKTTISSNPKF